MKLNEYGVTDTQPIVKGLDLARVIATSHLQYTIVTDQGQFQAQVSGRLANMAIAPEDFPTVGDWVQVRLPGNSSDLAIIERFNERQSVFLRKAAGRRSDAQLVAANVDWVLLTTALDANFNLRRLERYLAVAASSGAQAAIVLTKADKANDLPAQLAEVKQIVKDTPVLVCDATQPDGLTALAEFMQPGLSYAFLGSSGVGKSTLINHLLGSDKIATQAVRNSDAHGRHTTTSRQLIKLPNGSLVIDTPGMRELGLVDADVDATFDDIKELAKNCRFKDCTHQNEPGCAVQAAISAGTLSSDRLANYQRLLAEQDRNTDLRGKARENAKINRMFGGKKQMKAFRKEVQQRKHR
ncbi:ribosome small subunit-dependent GTPase A [Secundilactobacillus pentosiphilus]|uniref:Small ribosomal subunit biogenesis GTPase RsgA n=1 Tax=Secundilactobacillus pentosiphilus TaxID=1714682 RepID=A0A1Z5IZ95_9LACO|nr:ribosome small subunit-dependent GTPase A [Secundilactobacillus pentosiphilus]GAX07097.1 ribosome small subunit-dependent GTPase A [Secundilactobacillus pentosiphilus]